MFRRTAKAETAPEPEAPTGASPKGKGRPTPTRKEAEAAARERARAGRDKKAAAKLLRERRAEQNRAMRDGMKSGVEKYLPRRDQGPVRRYIRDWVDSRITFTEFILPILVVIMFLGWSGNASAVNLAGVLQLVTIVLIVLEMVWNNFRLKRELRKRFPGESLRGTAFYALLRSMQLRFMRMPKPGVKLGDKPR